MNLRNLPMTILLILIIGFLGLMISGSAQNCGPHCISGYKLDNCDGALPGWMITLTNGSYTTSQTTDGNGRYEFCVLSPSTYTLSEVRKPGWSPVSAPSPVTLTCSDATYQNFTNQKLLCISGYKLDNCDGALPGWMITLTNGSYTTSQTTDASGRYEFCGLAPGQYTVFEWMRPGWMPVTPSFQNVVLSCNNVTGVDFVNTKLLCINGNKLDDCTKDGLPGWTITLTNGSYTVSRTTDASGWYEFCGLSPGQYTVFERMRPGWMSVTPSFQNVVLSCNNVTGVDFVNTKLLCINGNKLDDSTNVGLPGWTITLTNGSYTVSQTTDASGWYEFCGLSPDEYTVGETMQPGWMPVTPSFQNVVLSCTNRTGVDFVNTQTQGLLGDFVWDDLNGNGIQDAGEPGKEGVTVTLLDATSVTVAITTTNANGLYSFTNLPPETYKLKFTLPTGYLFSPMDQGTDDTKDSDADLASGETAAITLISGQIDNNWDAGVSCGPHCISGYKLDYCTKSGLSGWTITLTNGSYTVSQTTDGSGKYEFCGLMPGAYTVRETIRSGWTAITSPVLSVTLSYCNLSNINFTNTLPACIEGFKMDEKRQGLSGWTIQVTDSNGASKETVTDNHGFWQVCGLENGTYTVCEVLQPGWVRLSPPDCYTVAMTGMNVSNINFTNKQPHCISGRKYDNVTGHGLAGWTITATDNSGHATSTITNKTGYWKICGLPEGNYTVCEILWFVSLWL